MGRPADAADTPPSTYEMVPESDPQSNHKVNPDIIGPTIEISPATYNSQHGQELQQESNQPHPTKMPRNSPRPSSQPQDNPINHHQQQFQFPLHQQASPSPSNQASYQPRDAPAHPQPPQEACYPPKAPAANYPPQSETPHVANYPPHSQPPQAANYPPHSPTAPANYPPQQYPQMYQNSYQTTHHHQQQQQQQPVQFPPQQSNPNATVYPQQAMPQAYPQTFPSNNNPGLQQNVSAAPGIPVAQTYNQPAMTVGTYGTNAGTEGWTTGLFDLMEDPQNALITIFFPCVTFGQIAEIIDNGHTTCGTSGIFYGAIGFLIGIPCLMSCSYRTKLRSKYDLVEAPAPDWLTHFLCECCALSQEYRELRNRGFDPALGWIGNLSRNQNLQQQQQIPMVAPMNQTMMG
ncbi:protein PLANT CADMIUM RESISTANCE 6-like [Macadamia integrifolia]|uniref:protein PLANT CADMIUM RESISTANCE 6-like n=1 Tax=Macadamia integrifolia TaxID=60698 RepID=UPI001C4E9B53|nr:protein PLANT CADMIUM RESISTANCE 6-like [Macadamia integrifolia]